MYIDDTPCRTTQGCLNFILPSPTIYLLIVYQEYKPIKSRINRLLLLLILFGKLDELKVDIVILRDLVHPLFQV